MNNYVLVHGAWGGAWEFAELAELLGADGSKVVAVDLPGHGNNKAPIADVTLAAYVQKVTEVIGGLDAKVILVGHSLAGSIISQVAENIPQQIEKPKIKQGMLEGSNVMPIIEMSKMISVHRTYDSVKNLIQREDDRMLQMVRNMAKVG